MGEANIPQVAPNVRSIGSFPALLPTLPTPPPSSNQIITVVHRLSGWKLLTWLALTSPPSLEIDEFPSADVVHTNIVAGLISVDGRTVLARLPQADVELESLPEPQLPPGLLPSNTKDKLPEYMLVRTDGTKVAAKFIGLDAATGLSLLEAAESLSAPVPPTGEEGNTDTPTVGQRVRLFAPVQAPVPPSGAQNGVNGDEGFIYLNMGETEGLLTDVKHATSGKATQVTARANLYSPAWTGAIATNSSGTPIGIVARSGTNDTTIVPLEAVRSAAARVLARRASVPQPWLGVRGDAIFTLPFSYWVERGWQPELVQSLVQKRQGVILTSVVSQTPAALAGLLPGDVITKFNGRQVGSIDDLSLMLRDAGVGAQVDFTVRRAKEVSPLNISLSLRGSQNPALETAEAELNALRSELHKVKSNIPAVQSAKLGGTGSTGIYPNANSSTAMSGNIRESARKLVEMQQRLSEAEGRFAQARAAYLSGAQATNAVSPPGRIFDSPWQSLGLDVIRLMPRSAARFGAQRGILVLVVRPGSTAAKNGLRTGDLIETINNHTFDWTSSRRLLNGETGDALKLGVIREGEKIVVQLSLAETK